MREFKYYKEKAKATIKGSYWRIFLSLGIISLLTTVSTVGGNSRGAGYDSTKLDMTNPSIPFEDFLYNGTTTGGLFTSINLTFLLIFLVVLTVALQIIYFGAVFSYLDNDKGVISYNEGETKSAWYDYTRIFKKDKLGGKVFSVILLSFIITFLLISVAVIVFIFGISLLTITGVAKGITVIVGLLGVLLITAFLVSVLYITLGFAPISIVLYYNRDLEPMEVIKKSFSVMKGQRVNLLLLRLSFILWFLLDVATLFLSRLFYTGMYIESTTILYMDDLYGLKFDREIHTEENLNSEDVVEEVSADDNQVEELITEVSDNEVPNSNEEEIE